MTENDRLRVVCRYPAPDTYEMWLQVEAAIQPARMAQGAPPRTTWDDVARLSVGVAGGLQEAQARASFVLRFLAAQAEDAEPPTP